jgi:hypothetical protein
LLRAPPVQFAIRLGQSGRPVQFLQGNLAAECGVYRQPHHAHPAAAKFAYQLVTARHQLFP